MVWLRAGDLEVVLDVISTSAEGDEHGPTLSLRGLDNASYYRLPHDHKAAYRGTTPAAAISLDLRQPRTLQLVLDQYASDPTSG